MYSNKDIMPQISVLINHNKMRKNFKFQSLYIKGKIQYKYIIFTGPILITIALIRFKVNMAIFCQFSDL